LPPGPTPRASWRSTADGAVASILANFCVILGKGCGASGKGARAY